MRITPQVTLLESAQMKAFLKSLCVIGVLILLSMGAISQRERPNTVRRLSVISANPFQLRIQTGAPVTPKVQMIAGPDRLVIDLPGILPGPELHGIAINRAGVRAVRTSLFSTNPPATRVVVDLNSPQWYRVVPDSSGLLISLGSDSQSAADGASTIGWVSTKSSSQPTRTRGRQLIVSRSIKPASHAPAAVNGVTVLYDNGELTIHAANATLSEVLFQIQKVTGAEIAIPSGTEQQRVAADFGPASASEVLTELLNGSGLNFVVVGSPSDPNILRNVILTQNSGAPPDGPAAFAQPYTPPVAQDVDPSTRPDYLAPRNMPTQSLPGNDPPAPPTGM